MNGKTILLIEEVVIILLVIASIVAIVSRRLRLPYTVGLVLIGLAISFLININIEIPPQIILALLVPPLVFEAAFHIRLEDLRRDFWLIMLLAFPGVILTTFLVGGMVAWGTGLAIPVALVFGALVSATDPVAVIALFKRLGAPRRLQMLLEGESLFNDGTAIVMYGLMLTIALENRFSLSENIANFLIIAGGGVIVGIVLGMLVSNVVGQIDDSLVETTLILVLAFGSYLLAEFLHVSGVLAVAAAGIVNGNAGPRGMSPTTRVVVFNFWETGAFLANSFIFLLVGLAIDLKVLVANREAIGWAIVAALLARVVSIYGFSLLSREISTKWKHVLFWGGLRGAITLALALSLPEEGIFASERGRLQAMAFGLVLFTLLVQGISMNWLMRSIKIIQRAPAQDEYERRHARFIAGRAAYDYLSRRNKEGLLSEHTWQRLAPILHQRNELLVEAVMEVMTSEPSVEAEELDTARREALRAQRAALADLLHDGVISEDTYSELVGEVDEALTSDNFYWPELVTNHDAQKHITSLMMAIIHESDFESASAALAEQGLSFVHLPSVGGFLRQGNVTLLIGLPEGCEERVVNALEESCQQRVEYVASPIPEMRGIMPEPVPNTVGGATIFTFEVEHWEEF